MFKRKSCKNCGEKLNPKNNFCPGCGFPIKNKNDENDYGMLGKNDTPDRFNELDRISNSMFSGFGGGLFGKMLNSTMKMLEKEMEKTIRETQKNPRNPNTNFELYINGKRVNPKNIKVSKHPMLVPGKSFQEKQIKKEITRNKFFSKDKKEQFLKFEKTEPKTNLKRLSDKIIYEVSLPGVKSTDDISIVCLESSIEIKAFSELKKKSYEKIIPIRMNLHNYYLENGILAIEFKDN